MLCYEERGGDAFDKPYTTHYKTDYKCVAATSGRVSIRVTVWGFDGDSPDEDRRLQKEFQVINYDGRGGNLDGPLGLESEGPFFGLSFPAKPVGVGDSWSASNAKSHGGPKPPPNAITQEKRINTSFTVLNIGTAGKRKQVELAVSITGTVSSMHWSPTIPGQAPLKMAKGPDSAVSGTGKITVDSATGLPIDQTFTMFVGKWRYHFEGTLKDAS